MHIQLAKTIFSLALKIKATATTGAQRPCRTWCSVLETRGSPSTIANCCHGGSRDKLTAVWVNESWIDSLEARCDGSHSHKSWKVTVSKKQVHFPTSEEAAYPPVLCQRIVECVKQKAIHFIGAVFSSTLSEQLQQPDADAAGRMALGALPRSAKVKPLVAEFGRFIAVDAPTQQTNKVDAFLFS